MPNWTQRQLEAIADRGHSLIVCAAAGSGKTAVLVERITRLVREGCPIERMLVVTFTNAAAGEMRLRIGEALTKAAAESPALGEQVMALPRASISTLHRFCGSLLREHFQALGIDPAFRVGDEQECGVLSRQAMEDALYACYDVGSEDFLAADRCYTQEELSEIAFGVHRFMMTRPDPWEWLDRAVSVCAAGGRALAEGGALRLVLDAAARELARLRRQAEGTLALCRALGGPAHYAGACEEDAALMDDLLRACETGYDALREALAGVKYARLAPKPKAAEYDEGIAGTVKDRREAMKESVKAMKKRFSASGEEAAADLLMTHAPLSGIAELVRTYDALYAAAKRRRNLMDFDDLEHGALAALEKEEVRAALRERYRYVFVDEYQDSSAIQEAILGSFAREDGLFLVGDVKQSIYRFRQAEPSLFLQKAEEYDKPENTLARRIDLQRNFRSRANVLEGVNAVFERIMKRDETEIEYDERERLICGLPAREDDPPLELHLIYRRKEDQDEERDEEQDGPAPEDAREAALESEEEGKELAGVEREALIAARRIRELVGTPFFDAKLGGERPLAYRDMTLLMRAARGGAPLAADILTAEGIPVFCDAGEGYFDIPEIRAMMALLRAIDNGTHDEALLAALRGPALGLTDGELAEIRMAAPDTRVPYHEAVRRYREEKEDELAAKLRGFENRLARWRLCARHQGVDRLIERIYAETGFTAQAGALPGGAARQANLHLLTSRARAFMRAQGGSLHAFLRYAERLRAGGDAMSASAIGESEDVVRIMTTHKSKGLEFPVVFVLGMGRRMKAQTSRVLMHAQLGIALPCIDTALMSERDTLLHQAIRLQEEREQLAEEVRILYVAMTRARDRLILIGDTGAEQPPESWRAGEVSAIRTELDMVAPALMAAGASLTIREEAVAAGDSRWRVLTHMADAARLRDGRTQEGVLRLLYELEATPLEDGELARLMAFDPGSGVAAVRKTSVSTVLRDEKRAALAALDGEIPPAREEIERLPRFMREERMTGAQIGTAFHRMMRMLDLAALGNTESLAAELARQVAAMRSDGVVTEQEARAVPVRMLLELLTSPLGVRMLRAKELRREWAFTYRRMDARGRAQIIQGVIDCCFVENGRWVLVDYKTDSAADIPGALERHRPQLDLYAEALGSVTGRPVAERILYLVRAGAGYNV